MPEAELVSAQPRGPLGLPVSASRSAYRSARPGVGSGHYLHPSVRRLSVLGRVPELVLASGRGVVAILRDTVACLLRTLFV